MGVETKAQSNRRREWMIHGKGLNVQEKAVTCVEQQPEVNTTDFIDCAFSHLENVVELNG